jgi:hypothetical protein
MRTVHITRAHDIEGVEAAATGAERRAARLRRELASACLTADARAPGFCEERRFRTPLTMDDDV